MLRLYMNDYNETSNEEQIEIREFFLALWRGKIFILFLAIFFIFLASMYLRDAERKYLVEYKLKPVGENQEKSSFSGLGRFASLAGIQLPSNSTNGIKIFKELISSVEVSEKIFKNKKLIRKIYNNEWDSSLNSFSEPEKNKFRSYITTVKKTLTGNYEINYMPPNARRLSIYISKNISVKEDKKTGFLTLSASTSKPEMLLSLISEVVDRTDQIMRQRYIDFSKEPLAFYKEKIRTARSKEHREALAELIRNEEQKLMFASKGTYFTVEPYIKPSISLYPIAPSAKDILLLSLIAGLVSGCGIILLRFAVLKEKNEY